MLEAVLRTGPSLDRGVYGSGRRNLHSQNFLPPKDAELLSIAFDVSITHMYAPGTRRHIKNALKAGHPWKKSWMC